MFPLLCLRGFFASGSWVGRVCCGKCLPRDLFLLASRSLYCIHLSVGQPISYSKQVLTYMAMILFLLVGAVAFVVFFMVITKKPAQPPTKNPVEEVQLKPSCKITDGQHVPVIIVGAGISGISSAYELQKACPGKVGTYVC